jgi:hypothetical protein
MLRNLYGLSKLGQPKFACRSKRTLDGCRIVVQRIITDGDCQLRELAWCTSGFFALCCTA